MTIQIPARATVNVYDGLSLVRPATPTEIERFLSRDAQPRAFHFLDRGMAPERASCFVGECVVDGIFFRVDYDFEGREDPASQIKRITGLLPD